MCEAEWVATFCASDKLHFMKTILILALVMVAPVFADSANELNETVLAPKARLFKFQLETAGLWQTRNEFRLPGTTGTQINLANFKSGPFFAPRFYAEWDINEKNGLRLLLAPLAFDVPFTPSAAISVRGQTFAAGTPVTARFKFNSYRLTYRYLFDSDGPWKFRLGATVKVRDANISVTDGVTTAEDPNLGFVPLLYFGVRRNLGEQWFADLDVDALAAPQGRAEDVALRLGYDLTPWELSLGYRFLEGGADNDRVYTFAFLHYAFIAAAYSL